MEKKVFYHPFSNVMRHDTENFRKSIPDVNDDEIEIKDE